MLFEVLADIRDPLDEHETEEARNRRTELEEQLVQSACSTP